MKAIIILIIAVVCLSTKSYSDLYHGSDTSSGISKSLVKKRHHKRHNDTSNFNLEQLTGAKGFDSNPDVQAFTAKQARDAGTDYSPVNSRGLVSEVHPHESSDEINEAIKDGMILSVDDTPEQISVRVAEYKRARLYKRIWYSMPLILTAIFLWIYIKRHTTKKALL